MTNIDVSDTIRRRLLVDTKSVDSCWSFFTSAAEDRFCCRPLALDDAKIFVASRLSPPLHGLWQLVWQARRGEELHEVRADASVAPVLEGAR